MGQGARLRRAHCSRRSAEDVTDLLRREAGDDARSSSTSCSAGLSRGKELADEGLIVADDEIVVDRFAVVVLSSGEEPPDMAVAPHPVDAAVVIDRDVTGAMPKTQPSNPASLHWNRSMEATARVMVSLTPSSACSKPTRRTK